VECDITGYRKTFCPRQSKTLIAAIQAIYCSDSGNAGGVWPLNQHKILGQLWKTGVGLPRPFSASGNLYGTTTDGGDDEGVVYQITP
jgi:hypothetical protein